MAVDIKLYEELHRYLDDSLSDKEKEEFEKELDNNKELYEQYCFELEVSDSLEIIMYDKDIIKFKPEKKSDNPLDDLEYIRAIIKGKASVEIESDEKKSKTFKVVFFKSKIFRYSASIAAILILVIGGYNFFGKKQGQTFTEKKQEQDLLAATSKLLKIDFYGTQGPSDDSLNALFLYGDYEYYISKSKEELSKHQSKDSIQLTANIARCYMLLGRNNSALEFLSKSSFSDDTCDIQFVRLIAFIRTNKFEEAKGLLSNFNNNYKRNLCPSYHISTDSVQDLLNK